MPSAARTGAVLASVNRSLEITVTQTDRPGVQAAWERDNKECNPECAIRAQEAHTARELELISRFDQVKAGIETESMRRANDLVDEYQQQQHSAFYAQ